MASVIRDPNGRKRIQWRDGDGTRRTLRLGKCAVKQAETVRLKIEAILAYRATGSSIDPDTARWVSSLPDEIHGRMASAGLLAPRERPAARTLRALLAAYFDAAEVKQSSRVKMEQARKLLLQHFEPECDPARISVPDAQGWRAALQRAGYAEATIARFVRYGRQFFHWGVRQRLVENNPFTEVRAGSQQNAERLRFIDRETIRRVSEAAPNAEWRLLIALSRFGGLRVPSEALALRWGDVDWANRRLTIRSPKTARHEGKASRVIPIFPELEAPLQEVFELAAEGAEHVIASYRAGSNLNPQLRRIIERAGLTPWPRTWHNLRASRQTELASEYPLHTVCAWIGNSKLIASGHYLQVTDPDWQRAVGGDPEGGAKCGAKSGARAAQNAAQRPSAPDRTDPREGSEGAGSDGFMRSGAEMCNSARSASMGVTGLEPVTSAV